MQVTVKKLDPDVTRFQDLKINTLFFTDRVIYFKNGDNCALPIMQTHDRDRGEVIIGVNMPFTQMTVVKPVESIQLTIKD